MKRLLLLAGFLALAFAPRSEGGVVVSRIELPSSPLAARPRRAAVAGVVGFPAPALDGPNDEAAAAAPSPETAQAQLERIALPEGAKTGRVQAPVQKPKSDEQDVEDAGRPFDAAPPDSNLSEDQIVRYDSTVGETRPTDVQWSPDSKVVTYIDENGSLVAYDWETKRRRRLIARVEEYHWSRSGETILYVSGGQVKLFDVARRSSRGLVPYQDMENLQISPDGKHVSFVRGDGLWVMSGRGGKPRAVTRKRAIPPRRTLTSDPMDPSHVRIDDYAWSPDSKSIAYLDYDDSGVPTFPLVVYGPKRGEVARQSYAMPGDPIGSRSVKVTTLDGKTRAIRLPAEAAYVEDLRWTPQGKLAVQTRNRAQKKRSLMVDGRVILADKDSHWVYVDYWQRNGNQLRFLPDGRPLSLSERDGYRHIYVGRKQLTKGRWNVRTIDGVDEKGGWVLYTGNEGDPLQNHIWRVSLDGKRRERLSREPGEHAAVVSPDGTRFVDHWSSVTQPPTMDPIHRPSPLDLALKTRLAKPEFLQLSRGKNRSPIDAMLLRPQGAEPGRKYPVIVYTYGGAGMPMVQNSWKSANGLIPLWHHLMTRLGFAVLTVDNSLSGTRSAKDVRKMQGRLGEIEVKDLRTAVNWLKRQDWVDGDRLGLWGWSFGGYMTVRAMTRLKDFAAGAAVAAVTNWRLYNNSYTETRLGSPRRHAKAYERSSVIKSAANLHGRLLILHGLHDTNVHFQHADHLITALDDAKKPYELRVYPGQDHHVSREADMLNLFKSLTEFFTRELKAGVKIP